MEITQQDSLPPAARILVVDDESLSRLLMDRMLRRNGHEVIFAENGEEALQQFTEKKPDLVFMDVMMGGTSGYDIAQQLKQIDLHGHSYVPIIFLTSLSDRESLVRCLESGGDDFLSKPFHYEILTAKINAALRTRAAYTKLQKHDREAKLFNERLEWEQNVTENIFKQIIGDRQPTIEGCQTYLSPAALSCGDFLLTAEVVEQPHTFQFIMGDFTGHGLSAAIGTLPVSNWFSDFVSEGRSIQEIAFLLNIKLKHILPVSHFCAMALFQLDMVKGELQVLNAGLPELLIVSEAEGVVSRFSSNHLPLGIMEQDIGAYTPKFYSLAKGERLFSYTDGVIEASNIVGEMFGSERLEEIFIHSSSDQWFDKIIEQVNAFQSKQNERDDITLIEIAFLPELYMHKESNSAESDANKLISVATAGRMLEVSENMMRSWIANGIIKSTQQLDNKTVLRKREILEIIKKREEREISLGGSEITIVLVEDDKALLELYTGLFNQLDMSVNLVAVTNGYEGLLRVGEYSPEMVITDLMMPEMNGFELIKCIRNNESHQNSQIVAVTALTSEQIESKGGLPDDVIVLKKPLILNELEEVIRAGVAKHSK